MDLSNLQRGPAEKEKRAFWRTKKGLLTPISYWDCIIPDTGESLIIIEFKFIDEMGQPATSLFPATVDNPNLIRISDLQFV